MKNINVTFGTYADKDIECGLDFCLEMQAEEAGERIELDEVIFEYYSM
ncbi:MAG: hypothetical protein K2H31_02025 [Lachnospiraceae bacterium]|nr:hypothetical protein [Lachnospiraceae bacterium]